MRGMPGYGLVYQGRGARLRGERLQRVCSEAAEAVMSGLSILVFIIDMSQIHRDYCRCVGDLWEGSAVHPEIIFTDVSIVKEFSVAARFEGIKVWGWPEK